MRPAPLTENGRAISRRLLSAGYGLREAATSLAEAFARAEDLVYVETSAIDALSIGLAGVAMGAGRTRADQAVDPAVGIEIDRKPGDAVSAGDVVARLIVRERTKGEQLKPRVEGAFTYADAAPTALPLVVGRVTA